MFMGREVGILEERRLRRRNLDENHPIPVSGLRSSGAPANETFRASISISIKIYEA
jgi:hypothetical protein